MNDFLAQLRERLPFILAVALTTLWIFAGATFVDAVGGVTALKSLGPADIPILVAAGAGPLAALWLFMAVLEQRRATLQFGRRVTEMMAQNRQSLQQAESQTRTLMQLQNQAARAQVMETRRMALQDMAASTSVLAERLATSGLDPKKVGERVVDAIRTKTFYAFVSAVPADVIKARHRRIEEALNSPRVTHY